MKKIFKLYIIAILGCVTIIGLQNTLYAEGSEDLEYAEDSESSEKYILDVKYYGWNSQDEPFEDYKQGENLIKVGEKVRVPNLGEQIKDKKVSSVTLGIDDDDIFEDISYRIACNKRTFRMPCCDVDLGFGFKDIDIKEQKK